MNTEQVNVCFPFVGDTLGGSHLSAALLLSHLDTTRFNPIVVVHETGPLTEYFKKRHIEYTHIPLACYVGRHSNPLRQILCLLRLLYPLSQFIRENNISIIHSHDARMHYTWTMPAWVTSAASIWHQRTVFSPSRIGTTMLKFCKYIICISNFVRLSLPLNDNGCVKVIPNPIVAYTGEGDRTQYRRILFEKANVQQGGKIIGMFGNLQAVKQPLSFVEVAAHMQGYLDCELIFAVFGRDRGGYEPRMRNLANTYGLGSSLVFMGFQDPVEPWIAACDVVLAPSAGDAFGRTLVEAMLEGVPVVASDAGGHHEIIEQGKNGLLVPVDNPREMAEAVTRLIRDQEFVAQLTACAKQQASNCYSIAKHVKAVSEVYEQVIMAER